MDLVADGYQDSDLPERYKVLIGYIDAFITGPSELSDDLRARMREQFTDEQILECTLYNAIAAAFSKMIVAIGTEPDSMPELAVVDMQALVDGNRALVHNERTA
jgi:alkylhydroperoxidase family enzyme